MKAKKSLGQNFLHSKNALRKMVDAGDPTADTIVLEIGPGKGALTKELIPVSAKVIAVEKDTRLISTLKEVFAKEIERNKLEIIEQDILDFDPKLLSFYNLPYKVIANIPYYITGAILKKFLSTENQPQTMVLMVQKEVARRIIARDKKESILSLSVKAYGTPRYVATIGKELFKPKPKVDSAILCIESISKNFFANFSEETFFQIVKTGFASKRKTLKNNLKHLFPNEIELLITSMELAQNVRAEDLPLEFWARLASAHQKHVPERRKNNTSGSNPNQTSL